MPKPSFWDTETPTSTISSFLCCNIWSILPNPLKFVNCLAFFSRTLSHLWYLFHLSSPSLTIRTDPSSERNVSSGSLWITTSVQPSSNTYSRSPWLWTSTSFWTHWWTPPTAFAELLLTPFRLLLWLSSPCTLGMTCLTFCTPTYPLLSPFLLSSRLWTVRTKRPSCPLSSPFSTFATISLWTPMWTSLLSTRTPSSPSSNPFSSPFKYRFLFSLHFDRKLWIPPFSLMPCRRWPMRSAWPRTASRWVRSETPSWLPSSNTSNLLFLTYGFFFSHWLLRLVFMPSNALLVSLNTTTTIWILTSSRSTTPPWKDWTITMNKLPSKYFSLHGPPWCSRLLWWFSPWLKSKWLCPRAVHWSTSDTLILFWRTFPSISPMLWSDRYIPPFVLFIPVARSSRSRYAIRLWLRFWLYFVVMQIQRRWYAPPFCIYCLEMPSLLSPFMFEHFSSPNWRLKQASIVLFGSLMVGPSPESIQSIINQGCNMLLSNIENDTNPYVLHSLRVHHPSRSKKPAYGRSATLSPITLPSSMWPTWIISCWCLSPLWTLFLALRTVSVEPFTMWLTFSLRMKVRNNKPTCCPNMPLYVFWRPIEVFSPLFKLYWRPQSVKIGVMPTSKPIAMKPLSRWLMRVLKIQRIY